MREKWLFCRNIVTMLYLDLMDVVVGGLITVFWEKVEAF